MKQQKVFIFITLTIGGFLFWLLFVPPDNFPLGKIVQIENGWSAEKTAQFLADQKAIRWPTVFKFLSVLSGRSQRLIAGYYLLDKQEGVVKILTRITTGDFHQQPVRLTFLEGTTARDLAESLSENLPGFNEKKFLTLALPKEGYLFPDTYYFYPGTTEEEIIEKLEDNFYQKISPLQTAIAKTDKSLHAILTMASILQKEASTETDQELIAGVLWKRLKAGVPLQVDAVFPYLIGKNSFTLTLADLKIDSPYNTYRYPGLPPSPIGNPGLQAIRAALHPQDSPYWFYLSDLNGQMHYSTNFAQHKRYKAQYLD